MIISKDSSFAPAPLLDKPLKELSLLQKAGLQVGCLRKRIKRRLFKGVSHPFTGIKEQEIEESVRYILLELARPGQRLIDVKEG